jgi:hypothetical protein
MLSSPNPQTFSSIHPTPAFSLASSTSFNSFTSFTSSSFAQTLPLFSTPSKPRTHSDARSSIPLRRLLHGSLDTRGVESHSSPRATRRSPLTTAPLIPFPATLASSLQPVENTATLNRVSANVDAASSISPLFATLTENTRGGGTAIVNSFVAQTSVCALLRQSTSEKSEAKNPLELKNLAVRPAVSHKSPVTASALFLPPVTSHKSLSPLKSALPQNSPLTPLESALPKHRT